MTEEEKVKLIVEAVEHLLSADLLEENGWTKEGVEFLKDVVDGDVAITIK